MNLEPKLRILYKIGQKRLNELGIQPYSPFLPTRLEMTGYDKYYDCPTVSQPYPTAAQLKYVVGIGSWTGAVPSGWGCTQLQVVSYDIETGHTDGQIVPQTGKIRIAIGPGTVYSDAQGRYIRMTLDEVWGFDGNGTMRVWHQKKPTYTLPAAPYFTADPEDAPIFHPAPFPLPLPFRLIPLRPDRGLQPSGSVQGIITRPAPILPGYADPDAGPAVQTDGGGLSPAPPHVFMPPGRGDKEKKHNGGPAAQALQRLMNRVGGPITEGADAIKAVYDALGKKCKGANTPQAQLQCIYTNWSTLDAGQAVANLIANEAQDRAIGKIGSAVKSVGGKRPGGLKPIGWGTGPAI